MSHPQGLVATVYPKYFNVAPFGSFTNYFTFMTGFDDNFMGFLGVKALRPEDLGWTNLHTKEEWITAVNSYFNPELPEAQPGSTADRYGECFPYQDVPHISSSVLCDSSGLHWTPPSVPAICFPLIEGATDYHWAVYNGFYWLEQAGHGGPINVWVSVIDMIDDVYKRVDSTGKLYVEGSHFYFSKRIA
jgi:hypothetical protein